jgi:3',5'-cyclic AMP phosphodiesterase CpdA
MAPIPANAVAETAIITAGESGKFKILQVTDLHFHLVAKEVFGEPQKVESIKSMVDIFKPDMIANTGDFWASNAGGMGADMCKWSCKEFAKFKTPWAFAWGNHDEANDYDRAHAILTKAPHSLYRGGAADGNYRIEVRAPGGAALLWNLIFLNNSRGGFKQEQIDWFNAEAGRIRTQTPAPPPALLFFHIPLPQYDDAAAAGIAAGVKFEKVCHEDGSREAFGAFRDAGFVRAMFCGHDHVNDYHATVDGIRMQYGRALGGYGEDKVRKGGTLITVDTDAGTFETISVFPDGKTWKPEGFITTPEPGRVY